MGVNNVNDNDYLFLLSLLLSTSIVGSLQTVRNSQGWTMVGEKLDWVPTHRGSPPLMKLAGFWVLGFFLQWMRISQLRYESSTLILYKELSSPIFQSCEWVSQWGIGNTCLDLHLLQYIKAWMSSTDPVSLITNCYRLIVSYTEPVHSFIIS